MDQAISAKAFIDTPDAGAAPAARLVAPVRLADPRAIDTVIGFLNNNNESPREQCDERHPRREELKQASLSIRAVSFEPSYQKRADFVCRCRVLRSFGH